MTGATITAITAEGVAANNSNKTVSFTASDGTTTADGTSESWNNRKSTTMTTGQAFNSANVNNFKCGAGQTYTFTNKSSGSYAAGARIVITYTSTLPTSLTNGATTDNSQAVSWTAPSPAPADGYLVAYSTSSTAPGNSVTSTTGSYTVTAISAGTTSATLSALSQGTTYYWWVRSKNARGNSSWVAGASFTTTVSACVAPSSVGVSGTWRCFPGQTISMTATPTSGTGTPSYQWQKEIAADNWSDLSNGTSDGVTISGATTNNLQITNCGTGNSGNYRCVVSTGATCSTTSDAFSVKIYSLNGAYDDNAFTSNNITYSSGTTGTATVHLAAGRVYKFKVTDNFGTWYGNTGRILEPAVDWTFSSNESENCVLFTGPEGDYTFTVDIDHVTYGTPEVVVSVGYPDVIHPAAGYAYFRNVDSWANVALYMWYEGGGKYAEWGSDPWVTRTTTICGNTYYYTPLIPSWYNRVIFHNAGGSGQTGDIVISNLSTYSGKYNDKSDASFHDFTTHTISFAANGGTGSMSSITGICPGSDQALTANSFTMAGYAFDYWTSTVNVKVGGVTVTAGSAITGGATLQDISADIPLSAHWKCNTPSISFDSETNTVTISAPAGATAYYTTDGSTPTSGSTAYSEPFTIDATKTIKAIAIRSGCTDSDVASQTCTYVPPVCFKMVADSEATSEESLSSGESITAGNKNCLTLSGGTAVYRREGYTMKVQKGPQYGWYFGSNSDSIIITLSGTQLQTGSIITIVGYTGDANGININGVETVTNDAAGSLSGSYTVKNTDTDLKGKNVLCLKRKESNALRLFSITISGCAERVTYAVTYNPNGATGSSTTHDASEVESIGDLGFTRTGYDFTGWNTNADGSGTSYAVGTAVTGTLTLYAQWEEQCFRVTDAGKNGDWEKTNGDAISNSDIDGTIYGGQIVYTGTETLTGNNTHGLIFNNDEDELTVTLAGSKALVAGTTITITQHGNSSAGNATGLKVNGLSMTPASFTNSSANEEYSQTYTVSAGSALDGAKSFTLRWIGTNQLYLKAINIEDCGSCTSISPALSAETANLYSFPVATSTTLTLDKDGSTGDVEWSVSPSGVVSVSGSGTEVTVTAIAAGTATVTAFIASDGDHCAKSVTKEFTVVGNCGVNVIAGVTRKSGSKTEIAGTEGSLYGGAGINTQTDGKLGSNGHYIYLTLSSGNYFRNGDIVVLTLNTEYSGSIYIKTGTTSPSTQVATGSGGGNKSIELTLSNVPASTSSITMYRESGEQNPYVDRMQVKRYTCPDGLIEYDNNAGDGNWGTTTNWVGSTGRGATPTIATRALIKNNVTVNTTTAKAKDVVLINGSQLEISAGQELIVASTVKVWNGSSLAATGVNDIVFNSDASNGLGALVMGSHDGTNKATVNFYTLSHGSIGSDASVNQYVGTPFNDENNILHNWYNSWVYGITYDGSGNIGWTRINAGSGMTPFYGYTVISADAAGHSYWQQGTLVASTDQTLNGLNWQSGVGTANGNNENLLANSWMAPIYIKAMETTDFVNTDATVYIFNSTSPGDFKSGGFAGNYTTYTVNTTSDDVIPAMQSFSVFTNATGGSSVTLDYSKIVYEPAVAGDAVPEANKAPHRENGTAGEADKLRLYVRAASGYGDMLYLWEQDGLSEGFDNGWDGRKMFGEPVAPQLYAVTPDGNMAINCVPDWEGTVLGFRKGTEDNTYTFTFEYEGEQTWYLNDMKEETSTRIMSENSYLFSTADGDSEARFIISATPISKVTTDIGEAGCLPSAVRKMVIDNHVYIIRNGRMYDATGVMMR
ncbi:MAG: chitobiase/beta-hexosaminidase C-terminal domain-containing protein [Paludibacteraceae bacterium]|nr:chitobiase/beta-hexosaminidase C-terminal domain-containing protein [Paludibacteraceae bacterium]